MFPTTSAPVPCSSIVFQSMYFIHLKSFWDQLIRPSCIYINIKHMWHMVTSSGTWIWVKPKVLLITILCWTLLWVHGLQRTNLLCPHCLGICSHSCPLIWWCYLSLSSSTAQFSGFSAHGIFQARMLEWFAFPSPGDLPNPRVELMSPALAGGFFTTESPGKPSD